MTYTKDILYPKRVLVTLGTVKEGLVLPEDSGRQYRLANLIQDALHEGVHLSMPVGANEHGAWTPERIIGECVRHLLIKEGFCRLSSITNTEPNLYSDLFSNLSSITCYSITPYSPDEPLVQVFSKFVHLRFAALYLKELSKFNPAKCLQSRELNFAKNRALFDLKLALGIRACEIDEKVFSVTITEADVPFWSIQALNTIMCLKPGGHIGYDTYDWFDAIVSKAKDNKQNLFANFSMFTCIFGQNPLEIPE